LTKTESFQIEVLNMLHTALTYIMLLLRKKKPVSRKAFSAAYGKNIAAEKVFKAACMREIVLRSRVLLNHL
jgi:hypothetical protein